jgi:hypothetical protein
MFLIVEDSYIASLITASDSAIHFPIFIGNRYTPRIDIPFTLRPETWLTETITSLIMLP